MCKLHHFGMKNVKTLLDPTYQILKIAVLSQSFTPGQPMSTTVDIGADAETKGYTMYNYTLYNMHTVYDYSAACSIGPLYKDCRAVYKEDSEEKQVLGLQESETEINQKNHFPEGNKV